MSRNFNENTRVQVPALIHLTRLGYTFFDAAKDGFVIDPETNILAEIFKQQFLKLNPLAHEDEFEREFLNIKLELGQNNLGRQFYDRLLGKKDYQLINWEHFNQNTFHITRELTCKKDEDEFRPDITVFVNGLPLAFIEVKQPNALRDGKTGIQSEALRSYERFNNKKFRKFINLTQLMIFSDNLPYDNLSGFQMQGAYYATTSQTSIKLNAFREERRSELIDGLKPIELNVRDKILKSSNVPALKNSPEFAVNIKEDTPTNQILSSLFTKSRLAFFLRYGLVYVNEANKEGNPLIQKHIMRYPQYFATRAIEARLAENIKKGVIWHTQGSGKTALAYFNVRYLTDYFQKQNVIPRFYFIVDRLDLARQADEEFTKRGLKVKRISSKEELSRPFEADIAVVNIQKFKDDTSFINQSGYALNIQNIYFIDEAHRSYNPKGSYLSNLYQADEESIKIALTGTPLIIYKKHDSEDEELADKTDLKTTRNIFGDYIHKYYYNQSIADGFTLRLMREEIETSYKEKLKETLKDLQVQEGTLNKKQVFAHPKFVREMLSYILTDLKEARIRFGDDSIGAMVVADSSEQARELYKQFIEPRVISLQTDFQKDELLVADSVNSYHVPQPLKAALILHDEDDKETREQEIKDFKSGKLDVLFVYSMLLTGFDAPRLKKLYLGRKIRAHNLLQALTRVNRPYKGYQIGYVVDFADISKEFDETNQAYFDELTREYDTGTTGENAKDIFGSLFVSADELNQQLEETEKVLVNYTTDNLEYFSREISAIEDHKILNDLRKALQTIKETYNMARLLGHTELLERIDISLFARLLTEVQNRLLTLNLLEHVGDESNSEELLNLVMNDFDFHFVKIGEEELELAANDTKENIRRTAAAIRENWDQRDPKWLSILEEFKRMLARQNMKEDPDLATMKEYNSQFIKIYQQIADLNRRDRQIADKFQGDHKYARTWKRLSGSTAFSDNMDLLKLMLAAKTELDNRVSKNEGMLANSGYYFEQEAQEISLSQFDPMPNEAMLPVILNFSKLISEEYLEEYKLA